MVTSFRNFVFSLILLFLSFNSYSQKSSLNYVLTILSARDSSEISFAKITLISNDSIYKTGLTDMHGVFEIEKKLVDSISNLGIEFESVGYKRKHIDKYVWKEKTKNIFYLDSYPWELDQIKIQGYKTPLIDKTDDKKIEPFQPNEIDYSEEEKNIYQSLLNGNWKNNDSIENTIPLKFSELYTYLNKEISYSQKAIDLGIQEKIYLSFWVNSDGKINRIIVRRGSTPVLVLSIVQVLSKITFQLRPQEIKEVIREEFLLPVNFVLD